MHFHDWAFGGDRWYISYVLGKIMDKIYLFLAIAKVLFWIFYFVFVFVLLAKQYFVAKGWKRNHNNTFTPQSKSEMGSLWKRKGKWWENVRRQHPKKCQRLPPTLPRSFQPLLQHMPIWIIMKTSVNVINTQPIKASNHTLNPFLYTLLMKKLIRLLTWYFFSILHRMTILMLLTNDTYTILFWWYTHLLSFFSRKTFINYFSYNSS